MKPSLSILAALATGLLLLACAAQAQKPATKPSVKATKPATKAPAKKAAPVAVPLPKAEAEQLAAAALAYYGEYGCEFKQTVNVYTTPKNDGYIDVRYKSQIWTMKPVLSSTGALRLEDVKGQMLMIQIANKSMLLDTRLGQRVVDECVHETQRAAVVAAAASAASQPAGAGLLQAPTPASAPASAPESAPAPASAPEAASAAASAPESAPAPASAPSAPR